MAAGASLGDHRVMTRKRVPGAMALRHLRTWRESLGLSRQSVVDQIAALSSGAYTLDQATLAKWEKGETSVKAEHLEILAQIYGVTPDRLHFSPGDQRTPEMLKRAHEIITSRDPEAVERWIEMGLSLRDAQKKDSAA